MIVIRVRVFAVTVMLGLLLAAYVHLAVADGLGPR